MSYYVYIVQCADGTLYTGTAANIDARVSCHNSGKGAKYTRTRLPVKTVYREKCPDKGAALSREYQIKHIPRQEKLQLMQQWEKGHPPVSLVKNPSQVLISQAYEAFGISQEQNDIPFLFTDSLTKSFAGIVIFINKEATLIIRHIGVIEQYQGSGLALQMLCKLLSLCPQDGITRVAATGSPGFIHLAKLLGMKPSSHQEGYACTFRHINEQLQNHVSNSIELVQND